MFFVKLADIAANVAAPPKTFFRVFFGVRIVSSAVEPNTVSITFWWDLRINPFLNLCKRFDEFLKLLRASKINQVIQDIFYG